MTKPIILMIESMSTGNSKMDQRAKELGYTLRLLTEDASIYSDVQNIDVIEMETRNYSALRSYVANHRGEITAIFSPTDTWGIDAARLRDEFGYPSRYSSSDLARFRDKYWVRQTLSKGSSKNDSYPRILKPRRGTGSTDITLVHSPHELQRGYQKKKNDHYIDEPFFRGPAYSSELYSDGSQIVFFGVTNRILTPPPVFLESVKTFPHAHATPWEKDVEQWSTKVLCTLGYNAGFAHLEFVETAHGFELIELNARMAGALITPAVEACTNYDPYEMLIDDALGRALEIPSTREITQGYSHVSIFAERTGTLQGISGIEDLGSYPGNPTWVPSKEIGARITELGTFRARIGNVYATANLPATAQDRAIAASQAIGATVT